MLCWNRGMQQCSVISGHLPSSHCMMQTQAFHDSIEREFWEFAAFYRLDMPSVKAAAFEHMRNAVEGFDVKTPRWALSADSGAGL